MKFLLNLFCKKKRKQGFTNVIQMKEHRIDNDVMSVVKSTLYDMFGITGVQSKPSASLAGDLGFDDLDHIEFIIQLEDHFDVVIPDENLDFIVTVDDVRKAIQKELDKANNPDVSP